MKKLKLGFFFIIFFLLLNIVNFVYAEGLKKELVNRKKKSSNLVHKKATQKSLIKCSKVTTRYNKNRSLTTYKIKKGDTIKKIAKIKGVSESEILAINKHINPRLLKPGQKILIPVSNLAKSSRDYEQPLQTTRYSVAKEEIEKFRKNKVIVGDENEESFDNESIIDENSNEVENRREITLYSLRNDDLRKLINSALDYIGANYKYGGDSVASLDCSAFVRRVFREVNISLPRTSREQYNLGVEVPFDDLREGDLIFFAKKNRINHVGIYIGNNMYIHAARKGKGVIVSSIESPYVKKHFVGARRIFTLQSASNEETLKEKLIN